MSIGQQLLAEFEQELHATRRVLERVPDDQLAWQPHPTAMSLGQLAFHVAGTPAGVTRMIQTDAMPVPEFQQPAASSRAEILQALAASESAVRQCLSSATDEWLMTPWSLTRDGVPVMTVPRAAMFRMVGMNHVYHHRGQLTMSLRMLGVPVPAVYGVSRDENPFA
ncbi:MAG: DinB family protein [Gemmatimonadaceae bacterium]